MRVGYARVSSTDQNIEAQLARLAGCEQIFSEKRSSKNSDRPQLEAALTFVRAGDTLVVTRLDRLARSTGHLCLIADRLKAKGVELQVLDQNIDTTTSYGRLVFEVLAAVAQFELSIRVERQRDGILHAQAHGVRFGREKALTPGQIAELRARRTAGGKIRELARMFHVCDATIYKYLRRDG